MQLTDSELSALAERKRGGPGMATSCGYERSRQVPAKSVESHAVR